MNSFLPFFLFLSGLASLALGAALLTTLTASFVCDFSSSLDLCLAPWVAVAEANEDEAASIY